VSLTIAYVALAAGVAVWFVLVRLLSAKSWETQPPTSTDATENRYPPARVGLWVFLAVVTSLFGLFVSAYYMRMGGHGVLVQDWNPLPEPAVLWLNTLVLILASVAMQMARTAVTRGQADRVWTSLLIGGLLTFVFLAGQFYAWRILRQAEFFTPQNPAIAFFYLLTAVHGAHLLGGLYVWSRTLNRMRSQEVELIDVKLSVELCSVYWHYLLLVWLGLFAVLLST
jgi:cytochrome c oxidase subunit 3